MHPTKKDINASILLLEKNLLVWMSLSLNLNHISFRGESKDSKEGNLWDVWDVLPNPLPTMVIESIQNEPQVEASGQPNLPIETNSDPASGGETLQSVPRNKNSELLVYTKRKHQQRSKGHHHVDPI